MNPNHVSDAVMSEIGQAVLDKARKTLAKDGDVAPTLEFWGLRGGRPVCLGSSPIALFTNAGLTGRAMLMELVQLYVEGGEKLDGAFPPVVAQDFRSLDARVAVVANEAWMYVVQAKDLENAERDAGGFDEKKISRRAFAHGNIADHPDRVDGFSIHVHTVSGTVTHTSQILTGGDGKRFIADGERVQLSLSTGDMTMDSGLLPENQARQRGL